MPPAASSFSITLSSPYTDHLGSIVALTEGQGIVLQRQAFDAWGRRRNPRDWETNDRMTPRPVLSGFGATPATSTWILLKLRL